MRQTYDIMQPILCKQRHLSPIIFLHGLLETRRTWKKVAPRIVQQTGRKAYALDARNHGDSPRSQVMDYDVLAQDVLDFMNENNIERAIIVGHSMGGRTAINFALQYPGRTEALVVEDMTPKNVSSGSQSLVRIGLEIILEALKSIPPECDLNSAKEKIFNDFVDLGKEFQKVKCIERIFEQWDPEFIPIKKSGDSFEAICNVDAVISMIDNNTLVQNLPQKNFIYEGDALFLYGDFGFFNLGRDTSIRKLFPRAIVKKIPHASHMMHFELPCVFAELVSHFIQHRNLNEAKL